MDTGSVLRQRLTTQRLSSEPLPRAADAVRLLTCVQSQERDHAFFSLALRSTAGTYAAVRAEHDSGAFVRTHILRPTWHFVAPEDLRWILALTSPRVEASMRSRHRQLGLDDPRVVGFALDLVVELLRDRRFRTRAEIGDAFAEHGSPVTAGARLGHLLMLAELRGLVCSGPMKGVHHSYALVDEVIEPPPERSREEAVVELVRRFFAGHGPAAVKDFTRWSFLTVSDTKAALAEIGDDLEEIEVDGVPLWFDPAPVPGGADGESAPAAPVPTEPPAVRGDADGDPAAYLFPTYDEVVLTYPALGFPSMPDHPRSEHPDPFWAWVVVDGVNAGLWKRQLKATTVEVDVRLAPCLGKSGRESVRKAAERLAGFLERDLLYAENDGRPHLWGGEAGHPARRPRRAAR